MSPSTGPGRGEPRSAATATRTPGARQHAPIDRHLQRLRRAAQASQVAVQPEHRPPAARIVSNKPVPCRNPPSSTLTNAWSRGTNAPFRYTVPLIDQPHRRPPDRQYASCPNARIIPAALASVSSYSSCGSLSATMPPPAVKWTVRPAHDHRADRDVQRHRAVEADVADRPGVDAARRRLQLVDDLHRPDLRRPGDRAAGKRRRAAGPPASPPAARSPSTVATR